MRITSSVLASWSSAIAAVAVDKVRRLLHRNDGVRESVERFFAYAHNERHLATKTISTYDYELRAFCAFLDARKISTVRAIARSDVVDYLGSQRLADATRNKKLATIRSFLRHAGHNVAADIPMTTIRRRERAPLTATQVERMANRAGKHAERDGCLMTVLFHTGLRLAELLSLDCTQVDLVNKRLIGVVRKGGDTCVVLLNRRACQALRRWLAARPATTSPALFTSACGTRLSARQAQYRVKAMGTTIGRPDLHPHLLRHSFATAVLAAGANMEVARQLMHHTSIMTTSRYSHPSQSVLQRAIEQIAA